MPSAHYEGLAVGMVGTIYNPGKDVTWDREWRLTNKRLVGQENPKEVVSAVTLELNAKGIPYAEAPELPASWFKPAAKPAEAAKPAPPTTQKATTAPQAPATA